jgi:hypothetical protein
MVVTTVDGADASLLELASRLQALPAGRELSPEEGLLATAGAAVLYQQIGWLPEQMAADEGSFATATIADERLPISGKATRYLERMLNQERPELLPEFLAAVSRAGRRVAPEQLPALLEQGAKVPRLRPEILPILGEHGRWLASLNPAWRYAVVDPADWTSLRAAWQQADLHGRKALQIYLRRHDPARGRQLLESAWKSEADVARRELIRSLETGLAMADEPFLERALDDRDALVRRKAAELLAALPDSRLCQRMIAHTDGLLNWTPGQAAPISVRFPPITIDALVRDGVLRPAAAEPTTNERTRMLIQIVGAISLSHWQEAWGVGPREIVQAVQTSKWPRTLTAALATAAMRQHNLEWAKALLEQDGYNERTGRLIAVLPAEECFAKVERLLTPTADGRPLTVDSPLLRFLRHWPHDWDERAGRLWVDFLAQQASIGEEGKATPMLRYQMRQLAQKCAPEVVDYAAERLMASQVSDVWRQTFKTFLATLTFRLAMLTAIATGRFSSR